MATYPVRYLNNPGKSELMNFFTTLATDPLSSELRSLTIKISATAITKRDITRSNAPMVESDRSV